MVEERRGGGGDGRVWVRGEGKCWSRGACRWGYIPPRIRQATRRITPRVKQQVATRNGPRFRPSHWPEPPPPRTRLASCPRSGSASLHRHAPTPASAAVRCARVDAGHVQLGMPDVGQRARTRDLNIHSAITSSHSSRLQAGDDLMWKICEAPRSRGGPCLRVRRHGLHKYGPRSTGSSTMRA